MVVKKKKKSENEFEEMMKQLGDKTPTPYAMDSSYSPDEFLDHKVFGIGKVINLIAPDKMTVQFMDGEKILICVIETIV